MAVQGVLVNVLGQDAGAVKRPPLKFVGHRGAHRHKRSAPESFATIDVNSRARPQLLDVFRRNFWYLRIQNRLLEWQAAVLKAQSNSANGMYHLRRR